MENKLIEHTLNVRYCPCYFNFKFYLIFIVIFM